MPCRVSGIA